VASAAPALERERRALLGVLLVLAAAGWVVVLRHSAGGGAHDDMAMGGVDLTMGMGAPLFLAMWTAMMVAMMFPASAPMILAFSRSQSRRREQGRPHVPTWLFIAPYLCVWLAFGGLGTWLPSCSTGWRASPPGPSTTSRASPERSWWPPAPTSSRP
jgi:predicted metal-binding membrane protein